MIKLSTIILACCLTMTGCALIRPQPDTLPGAAAYDSEGNHYYHFIRAEMENRHDRTDQAIDYMSRAAAGQPESVYLKKELAYLYLQKDHTEKALEIIEEILAEQPEDIETIILAGTIKKQAGQEEEAASIFETVLGLDPKREKIYHVLGGYYLEKNDLEKAAGIYERMAEHLPESWEPFFLLGKIRTRQKNFPEAEKNYQRCLELEKRLNAPRFELIELYKKQSDDTAEVTVQTGDTLFSLCRKHYGLYNKALTEKIIAANPGITDINSLKAGQKLILPGSAPTCDPDCHEKIIALYHAILADYPDNYRASMELALYHYATGHPEQADNLLIDLGRKNDSNIQPLIQHISQLFTSRQKYNEARTVLAGLLMGAPDNAGFNYILGLTLSKMQQEDKALYHFSLIKEDSNFYTAALLQMAFLHEKNGQQEKAQTLFKLLLAKEPDNVELLLYAGAFMERREQYEQAKELFMRGLSLEPQSVDLLFRLGVIYDKTGDKEAVIEQMKAIIEIAPDDANALNYLGYTYAELGIKLDDARELIEKALQIDPDNGYITDSLGWVYYQKGEMGKAIDLLNRANSLTPDDPILLEHLGDAYLKNGDTEKALEAYRRGLEFAPKKDKDKINEKIRNILQPTDKP